MTQVVTIFYWDILPSFNEIASNLVSVTALLCPLLHRSEMQTYGIDETLDTCRFSKKNPPPVDILVSPQLSLHNLFA